MLLQAIGGMQQSAKLSCELFAYVLVPSDFATTLSALRELIYSEETKLRLIVMQYQKEPQRQKMNQQQLLNLMSNTSTLTRIDFSEMLRNPDYVKDLTRASVLVNKSRTSLDLQTQDSISVKVKTLLEADVDLMGWYQIAEAQKENFEKSADNGGFYSPKPYQMYIAAKIC